MLLATLIIMLALAMALGQLLLPLVHRYPDQVTRVLGSWIGQSVSVSSIRGEWQSSGPLLQVRDLAIGDAADRMCLPHARLKIDFGAWLSKDRRWLELRLNGVKARLQKNAGGRWQLAGIVLDSQAAESANLDLLTDLPFAVLLRNLDLQISDAARHRDFQLHAPIVHVVSRHGVMRLGGQVSVTGAGSLLSVAARVNTDRSVRVYLAGDGLDLAAWAKQLAIPQMQIAGGHGNARLWLAWQDGRFDRISAELNVTDLDISGTDKFRKLQMTRLQGLLQATRVERLWRLAWQPAGADGKTRPSRYVQLAWLAPDNARIEARSLDVAQVLPWAVLLPQVPAGLAAWLNMAQPHGLIDAVDLDWHSVDQYNLTARISGVGWHAGQGMPGVDHVDAWVRGDGQAVDVRLPSQAMSVDVAGVFRNPFVFNQVSGAAALWQAPGGWRLGTDAITFSTQDFAGVLRGSLSKNIDGGLPVLDAAAVVTRAQVPAAKQFWPVNVMSAAAVDWLDRGLVSGQVTGRALFRGGLADWPFRKHDGRFEAVADLRDAVLDFNAEWPVVEALDARARFVNTGMEVQASAARTLGNIIGSATAQITDFVHAVLDLQVHGHGPGKSMLAYLRKTPIGKHHKSAIDALQLAGSAKIAFKLGLPLHIVQGQATVLSGKAQLTNAEFAVPSWSFAVNALSGDINFDMTGFNAESLQAHYNQVPVTLAVRAGDAVLDPAQQLEAGMSGHFSVAELIHGRDMLAPLLDVARGSADFKVGLKMPAEKAHMTQAQSLSVDSDLRGVALDLPDPLHKQAGAELPMRLQMELPPDGGHLQFKLGQVLAAQVRLAAAGQAMAADIALSEPAHAVPPKGIHVHGYADTLDISGWLRRAMAMCGGQGQSLDRLNVKAGHALVLEHDLGQLDVAMQTHEGDTLLSLDGDRVHGSIRLPGSNLEQRGITAKLHSLHWPESTDEADEADTGTSAGIAPAAIPPLHLWIGDLQLGKTKLGEVRFESVPIDDGMQIEQLKTHSADVQISARGRWTGNAETNHTQVAFDLSSSDLGRMLDAFGYTRLVAGGSTLVHIDGRWPGPPSAFSLVELDGTLKLHVSDGRVLEVEPGVGRLFGLLSIRELPRRFSLDFSDIFRSGLSFNSIDGHLLFAGGNAQTDDLAIRGPSAVIDIRGRIGLRQRDYDQWITVIPHLGGTLPMVGALAGGPVGAAAGLAVQTLLGNGLNRAAQARYHITGSWDKPDIVLVARDDRQTPAVPAASAAGKAGSSEPVPSVQPKVPVPGP